jgi:hypothetical protein
MLENKLMPEPKPKVKAMSKQNAKNLQLQRLQEEIDKLALLVNEAKCQSDRIQAAADALGDAVFAEIDAAMLSAGNGKRNRSSKVTN